MINRTYFVNLPSSQRVQTGFVDICVRATMGTRGLPVADPVTYGAANVTAPPAGWVAACGGSAYYETRGRTISFEQLFGATGFTQRANLGFSLSVQPYGSWVPNPGQTISPCAVQLSQSLMAHVGGDTGGAIPVTDLADPVYGVAQPVIRIQIPTHSELGNLAVGVLVVTFSIFERKDEDFTPVGGP